MSHDLSSASVVIGALRVKCPFYLLQVCEPIVAMVKVGILAFCLPFQWIFPFILIE